MLSQLSLGLTSVLSAEEGLREHWAVHRRVIENGPKLSGELRVIDREIDASHWRRRALLGIYGLLLPLCLFLLLTGLTGRFGLTLSQSFVESTFVTCLILFEIVIVGHLGGQWRAWRRHEIWEVGQESKASKTAGPGITRGRWWAWIGILVLGLLCSFPLIVPCFTIFAPLWIVAASRGISYFHRKRDRSGTA